MTRIVWDEVGSRRYETGVDRGVLYVDGVGTPWNGLISVNENNSGGEARARYVDGVKYSNRSLSEEFEATVTAFSSPVQFDACDGSLQFAAPGVKATQQRRKPFALSYRTMQGNDLSSNRGYRIHIVYNALAEPTPRGFQTIGSEVDPLNLTWNLTTRPKRLPGLKPGAHIVIDSTEVVPEGLKAIEDILYGDENYGPRLLEPQEIIDIFTSPFEFIVTANMDGTYTIGGPPSNVHMLTTTTYEVTHAGVTILDSETAEISSD